MRAVRGVWHALSSRVRRRVRRDATDPDRPGAPGAVDVGTASIVRDSIRRTVRERGAAETRIGGATVTRADIERALIEQRHVLVRAREQILAAVDAVQRTAVAVATDRGPAAAAAYERTRDGLRAQAETVEAAMDDLARLHDVAVANVARAQVLLRATMARLDDALRAEVQLLSRLERMDRERALAAAMLRATGNRAAPSP
jgi:hypothetical protein